MESLVSTVRSGFIDAGAESWYNGSVFVRRIYFFLAGLPGILLAGQTLFAQGEGDQYVRNAVNTLRTLRTIQCDIRTDTFLDGKEYAAWGRYTEQALPEQTLTDTAASPFRSVYRLEMNFTPNSPTANDAEPNRMTLVCYASEDGQTHQIERYTFIEGLKMFRVIDLKRIETRLRMTQAAMFIPQISAAHNLGDLAGKMQQIIRLYEFTLPIQENIQTEETVPALKLTGTLRNIHRQDLLTRFGGLTKRGGYPSAFPSDIELWLGQHNDFPYRIRYYRRPSESSEQRQLLLQESYHNVRLNGEPIPRVQFTPLMIPDDVFRVLDETDSIIRSLEL